MPTKMPLATMAIDSIAKTLVALSSFVCSVAYLIFYLLLNQREDFHHRLAQIAVIVFVGFVIWAIGREPIVAAAEIVKSVWPGDSKRPGTPKKK